MAISLQRDVRRDAELIADYKSKNFSLVDLTSKYQITPSRMYQVLSFYGVKRNRPYGKKKRKSKK